MEKNLAEEYLRAKVHPILQKLVVELLVNKPDDPLLYMSKWISNAMQANKHMDAQSTKALQKAPQSKEEETKPTSKQSGTAKSIESDSYDSQVDLPKQAPKPRSGPRTSVSAQAFGMFNKKKSFKPVIVPKTSLQIERIQKIIMKSFMFNSLEPQDIKIVIDAMNERTYKPKDWVIKQYDDGNQLYIVESGELDCFKEFTKGAERTYLKTYKPGESFGELSLLYNVPRQASIQAKTNCVLWSLDRETFSNIVQTSVVSKREKYDEFLKKVKLFKGMDPYQLTKLGETLKCLKFEPGEYVCRENDPGNEMYLIEDGNLVAIKTIDGIPKQVYEYFPGDYFGEISLVKKVPRQASIKTKTKCVLLSISKQVFDRMIGTNNPAITANFGKYTGLKLDK